MRISKYIVSVRPHRSSSEIDRCLLESRQLPVSRPDLFTRQSIAPRAIEVFIKVLAITMQRKLSRQSFEEVKQMPWQSNRSKGLWTRAISLPRRCSRFGQCESISDQMLRIDNDARKVS
jgi:hypothetical protein